ncbi:filamentous hemagglutinin N-terminal domain-containing protein [Leptolyngbya sp. AN02str]|uniref:two-partner secretion domain-containing protein n=1 Tax=Leptolyngbya sp. AN02str TaxID=3423363 RepID=UPI003D30FD44
MGQTAQTWLTLLSAGIRGGAIALSFGVLGTAVPAWAQLTPNATWGPENSTVTSTSPTQTEIGGGARRDSNLFHDFAEFNVGPAAGVYFRNPAGVNTIVTRVTGGNASTINGTLGVLGPADLFLLNPSGVVFGANAELDVQGAFFTTTASGLQFGSQGSFTVGNPAAPPLLTIQPNALLFTVAAAQSLAPINLQPGAAIATNPGQSLVLAGGNINLTDATLTALGGHVTLASVGQAGTLPLTQQGDRIRLSIPNSLGRGDIALNAGSQMTAASSGGGSIHLAGRNILLNNESEILGGIAPGLGSPTAIGAAVNVNSTGTLQLNNRSVISANIGPGSIASQSGDITVQTERLRILEGSGIDMDNRGTGRLGNLTVTANEFVELSGCSPPQGDDGGCDFFAPTTLSRIRSNMGATASGQAGTIRVTTPYLTISRFAQINSNIDGAGTASNIVVNSHTILLNRAGRIINRTSGVGNAGAVEVNATGDVWLSESRDTIDPDGRQRGIESGIFSDTAFTASGNGGTVTITANTLRVFRDAQISGETRGSGQGGDVSITANAIEIGSGGEIITQTSQDLNGEAGDAGNVVINTNGGSVVITGQGSRINAEVGGRSSGNGGQIVVNTGTLLVQEQGAIAAGNRSEAGNNVGGNIVVNANRVDLLSGGRLETRTDDEGNGGNITVNTNGGTLYIAGRAGSIESGIRADAVPGSSDRDDFTTSGNILINTGSFIAEDDAEIGTEHRGTGQAGTIQINANRVQLTDGAVIFARARYQATSGSIVIDGGGKGQIVLSGRSFRDEFDTPSYRETALSVQTFGTGAGGNITIRNAQVLQVDGGATIVAETANDDEDVIGGDGGNIAIQSIDQLLVLDGGVISARSRSEGAAGSITIDANGGAVVLSGQGFNPNSSVFDDVDAIQPSSLTVSAESSGAGGNLVIRNARLLRLQDGAQLVAASLGEATGAGGSISLEQIEQIEVVQGGRITASTETAAEAGNVVIDGGTVFLAGANPTDAAQVSSISARTTGSGNAGSLLIRNVGLLQIIDGARIEAIATADADGDGGSISVLAQQVSIANDGAIAASAEGESNGGNVTVIAADSVALNNGQITAQVASGTAGNLAVTAQNTLQMTGDRSSISVAATNPDGIAGNLALSANALQISDGAEVTVSNPAGQAGSVTVTANTVALDRGRITAQTGGAGSASGANIVLNVNELLTLQTSSEINAQALDQANGGSISINTPNGFVAAAQFENSDIIANAVQGQGGEISVSALGVFGLLVQSGLSTAQLRSNITSDISASSEAGPQGLITISTLGVDPSQGLTELPGDVVDAADQIAQGCSAGGVADRQLGQFVVTGRGGLPASPMDIRDSGAVVSGWAQVSPSGTERAPGALHPTAPSAPLALTEAHGWVRNDAGEVMLVADATPVAAIAPTVCP